MTLMALQAEAKHHGCRYCSRRWSQHANQKTTDDGKQSTDHNLSRNAEIIFSNALRGLESNVIVITKSTTKFIFRKLRLKMIARRDQTVFDDDTILLSAAASGSGDGGGVDRPAAAAAAETAHRYLNWIDYYLLRR